MFYVYKIVNDFNDKYYIGYTNNLKQRWNAHRYFHTRRKSKLYNYMKKYGFDSFTMHVVKSFTVREEALEFEISLIDLQDALCLNLAKGGEGGFVVPEDKMEEWRIKLRTSRKGRKPALGMRHTDDNKRFFSECSRRKVSKYEGIDFKTMTFPQARDAYGISKTHFHRLRKK